MQLRSPRRPSPLLASVLVTTGLLAPVGVAAGSPPNSDGSGGWGPPSSSTRGARFVPVEPCRLLDSRGDDHANPEDPLPAESRTTVNVGGECDVPRDAVAAALTVTAVNPAAAGYVTVYPSGTERPGASTVNYQPGQVVANLQLTRLSGGQVLAFTLAETHLVIDVSGYFERLPNGESEVRRGRYVALAGTRVYDTRESERPGEHGVVTVDTSGADVPDDAIAVAVNITTDATVGADYFTAYAAGGDRPTASVLNVDGAGQSRAAAAIVPVDDARFDVYTRFGNHVIVDLLGYFTGSSASSDDDGLFVPIDPFRLWDTRRPAGDDGGPRLWDHGGREVPVDELDAPNDNVAALAVNVTVTETEDAGWVAVAAAGVPVPGTSSVNYPAAQQTVANAAIVGVSERGVQAHALASTHVVIDVTGWFTGALTEAVEDPPENPLPPPRKVTVVGDSVLAGIRWNGASAGFQGFEAVDETHSCRRLVQASCRGREGYRPISALPYIESLTGVTPEEILVIGLGYDDWHTGFSDEFDRVVAAARAKGFRHIAWMTLRTGTSYQFNGVAAGSNYGAMNAILLEKVASGAYPEVRIWDFNGYTHGATSDSDGWFYSDGVHLRPLGGWAIADWISRHVAAFDDRPCPQPWEPGQVVDDPCPNPDPLPVSEGYPDIAGLYR